MRSLLPLLSFFPLGFMVVSDLRRREVSPLALASFALSLGVGLCVAGGGVRPVWRQMWGSVALLALFALVLWGYFALRGKPLRRMLGLGDALFLLAVSPAMHWTVYLRFLVGASLSALLCASWLERRQPQLVGIPFVTVSGVCFALFFAWTLFSHGRFC